MIFIPISLVLNNFAGNSAKAIFKAIFPSIEKKTRDNWFAGRNRFNNISKEKMVEDLSASGDVSYLKDSLIWDRFSKNIDAVPSSIYASPWHATLSSVQEGFLASTFKGNPPPDAEVFLCKSMRELKCVEGLSGVLFQLIQSSDFEGAKNYIQQHQAELTLFNGSVYGSDWLDRVADIEMLKQYMWGARFNSFLYLLSLLDCSLTREALIPRPQSNFDKFLPRLEDGKWMLPLHIWFEELLNTTELGNYSDLAKKLTEQPEWGTVRQNIYRWRRGKPIPPWEEIHSKLRHLEKQQLLSGDESFLMLLSFGLARTIHSFHFYVLDNGFTDEVLEQLYGTYSEWYQHHYGLNTGQNP